MPDQGHCRASHTPSACSAVLAAAASEESALAALRLRAAAVCCLLCVAGSGSASWKSLVESHVDRGCRRRSAWRECLVSCFASSTTQSRRRDTLATRTFVCILYLHGFLLNSSNLHCRYPLRTADSRQQQHAIAAQLARFPRSQQQPARHCKLRGCGWPCNAPGPATDRELPIIGISLRYRSPANVLVSLAPEAA